MDPLELQRPVRRDSVYLVLDDEPGDVSVGDSLFVLGRGPADVIEVREAWELVGGERLTNVHPADKCAGDHCCIHNPSNHHMRQWKMHWRSDRRIMERICPEHGTGHPDPDDPSEDRVHGCCIDSTGRGCCEPR